MSDHVYKTLELTGTSEKGLEQAVENAIAKASSTVDNLRWFQIIEQRGAIENGKVSQWQVTLKVSFTIS